LLIIYIILYYKLVFKLLKYIFYELKENTGEKTKKDIIRQKLDNLKLILLFYENDINKILDNLNTIYNEYKYNYNIKIKEQSKLYKRQGTKDLIDNNKESENIFQSIKKLKKFNIIKYSKNKKIYFYSIYFILLITILIYAIVSIIWSIYYHKSDIMVKWIPLTEESSIDTNRFVINYLMMIYNNQTLDEISSAYESKDYISYVYRKLTNLYEAEKYTDSLSSLFAIKNVKSIYNCTCFYENLENEIFTNLKMKFKENQEQLSNTIIMLCEWSNVMKFKNYITFYLQFFNLIQSGMENYKNEQYSDIINFIDEQELYKIEILYILTYIYLLDILNQNVKNSMMVMVYKMKENIIITIIFFIVLLVFFILIIFFVYIRNVNKDYQSFIRMKNIFKVCNVND
jgi:hypothetical protein